MKAIEYRKLKDINKSEFSADLTNLIDDSFFAEPCFKKSVSLLTSGTLKLLNQYAPLTKKVISVINEAPWFDAEYRELRKLRRKAERIRKRSIENQIHYKDLCKKCSDLANFKKKEYFTKLIDKAHGNPKTLFMLVNKELDRKQSHTLG